MAAPIFRMENSRDQLSKAIVEVLVSWPAVNRHIFTQVHYAGMKPEWIANRLDLQTTEVDGILRKCENELRLALKTFRETTAPRKTPFKPRPRLMTLVSV